MVGFLIMKENIVELNAFVTFLMIFNAGKTD